MQPPLRSEFVRNVATLMTGTTVAQALPIAISPILTRLYSPEDFGVLALFVSITAIFGTIANGRYELALMLPESDEEALNVAALALLLCSLLSAFLLAVSVIFNEPIRRLLGKETIGPWLYLVGPAVFLLGLFNVLNYYNNRLKCYPDLARANILKAFVLSAVQLAAGFARLGAGGLIAGQIISSASANARLIGNTLARVDWRATVHWSSIKAAAKRYRRFPAFSLPAGLANTLAWNLTQILVSSLYSLSALGYYSIINRVLGTPSSLVGASVGQVFFQRAVAERAGEGDARRIFARTVLVLTLLSIPVFGLAFLVAEDAFALLFGDEWRIAGVYAQILVPFFAIRFVVSAVSTITSVFEKQGLALAWQLLLLFVLVGSIFISSRIGLDFSEFVSVFAIAGSLCYLVLGGVLFLVARGRL